MATAENALQAGDPQAGPAAREGGAVVSDGPGIRFVMPPGAPYAGQLAVVRERIRDGGPPQWRVAVLIPGTASWDETVAIGDGDLGSALAAAPDAAISAPAGGADGRRWTVWMPSAADDATRVDAAPGDGRRSPVFHVDTQYGQISAYLHDAGCADPWRGGCSCGADAPLTGARQEILAAARAVMAERITRQAARARTRQAAEDERMMSQAAWARQPDRIVVGGSDDGWRLWAGSPLRNTGVIVAPPGPITGFDPHFVDLVDDYVILYNIRDPRSAGLEQG